MTENNIEDINLYEQELQKDNQAFEAYLKNIYEKHVPRPTPPTKDELSFWRIAGLESSLFVLSAIGAAFGSAIRTGGLFWLLETLLFAKFGLDQKYSFFGDTLGLLSMVFSLLAFEGFLLGHGLARGRESGKIETSKTGIFVSMLTVIAAGIFSSFGIVDLSDEASVYFNVALALITGVAFGLVAYYSSENFGFILNNVTSKRNKILSNHQKDDSKWREAAREEYEKSNYNIRKNASSKIYNGNQGIQQSQKYENPSIINEEQKSKKLSKSEQAYDFVRNYYLNNNSLPTNKIVSEKTGLALGTAFSAIENFVFDNADELISKGLVSQEKVEKIRKSKGVSNISVPEWIENWIVQNNKFPDRVDIESAGISMMDVAKWVSENQDKIRELGILDEESIQGAVKAVQG